MQTDNGADQGARTNATEHEQRAAVTATDNVRRRAIVSWALAASVIALFALFLATRYAPAIVTPDANGYWAQGSRLATEGKTWFTPEARPQYIGIHWLLNDDGRYVSRYPPGLAVLCAGMIRAFGPEAGTLINPLFAVAALLGLFLLGRRFLGPWYGVAGVVLLAVNPLFVRHALACDSHMAVTCLLVWGLWLLIRWSDEGGAATACIAGFLLGLIPAVRYPEAIYAVAVGVFLIMHWRQREHAIRDSVIALAGALVPVAALMTYHQVMFGAFWRTAYALTQEQTGFSPGYFTAHFRHYLKALLGEGPGPVFALAVPGIALMCMTSRVRKQGILFLLLALPVMLLYMAYYWAPQHNAAAGLRFLLPTFPVQILAALWFLHVVTGALTKPSARACLVSLAALQLAWALPGIVQETRLMRLPRQMLAALTAELEKQAEPGAVILAHPQVLQHLDYVRKWRLADPSMLRNRRLQRRVQANFTQEDGPAPMQRRKLEANAGKYGKLGPLLKEYIYARDIREWAEEHPVYYVGAPEEIERMRGRCFAPDRFRTVSSVTVLDVEEQEKLRSVTEKGPGRARRNNRPQPVWPPLRRWMGVIRAGELVIAEWTWQPYDASSVPVAP